MKRKWMLLACLTTLTASGALAGCSGGGDNKEAAAGSSPAGTQQAQQNEALSPATLKIYIPGDRPKDMDAVIAEAEKRMEGTLNVKLNITFIPWSDLDNKTSLALASGEAVDLIFDAPWLHMNKMVASDTYEDLEPLLQQYGQTILKTRPQEMWDANKFNGHIYGIPLGVSQYQIKGFYIRKDLREKYGMQPLKTFDDLSQYLYKVKENEQGMSPLTTLVSTDRITNAYPFYFDSAYDIKQEIPEMYPFFYKKNNDGKIYTLFEKKDEGIWSGIQGMRKWYQDGIVNKDNLAVQNERDLFTAGKTAAITSADVGIPSSIQDAVGKLGGSAEWVTFMDPSQKYQTDFKQWNFISVPKSSKNKERAIMFLNWANEKENYDLLSYGLEGKNWQAVGEDGFKALNGDYPNFGFDWIWNPTYERYDASLSPDELKWWNWAKDAANFTKSKDSGFTFNPEPVLQQMARLKANSYVYPILLGTLDPDKSFADFEAKYGADLKKIQAEYQKQLDAYLAAQK